MSSLPDGALSLCIAGVDVWLLAERALYIPSESALCVADVHVGKAAALQANAMAVPEGASAKDLHRLTTLASRLEAARLVVAGDFVHAPESLSPPIRQALLRWSAETTGLQVDIVQGNHDRGAAIQEAVPTATLHVAPLCVGPFLVQHYPDAVPDAHVIAGHLHPGVSLTLGGRDRVRVPCFWIQEVQTVLPAFGSFTGFSDVPPKEGRHAVIASDRVLWAPNHLQARDG